MFIIYREVRKEGLEKYINYDFIFVKLYVFVYVCIENILKENIFKMLIEVNI